MKLYVFDLDKTLVKVNSSFYYYLFLKKRGYFSFKTLIRALRYVVSYNYFKLPPKKLHEKVFSSFLKGRALGDVVVDIEIFVDDLLKRYINERVFFYLEDAKIKNFKTLLLSNSPDFLVEVVAKKLGIDQHGATLYDMENGRFFAIKEIMDGPTKLRYVLDFVKREDIKREDIMFFSDSIWDRALLEYVGAAFVVDPDKKLLSLAKAKGWELL